MIAIRCLLCAALLMTSGCSRWRTGAGSLDPEDYRSTDLSAYRSCFVEPPDEIDDTALTVTFLGTTSMVLDDGTTQLLIDGFISRPRVRNLLVTEVSSDWREIGAVLSEVKADRVAGVFVAHSHYDHALDSAHVAKWTGAPLYGSSSTLNLGHGAGLPVKQLHPLRPGAEIRLGAFGVTPLPSVHSPPDLYNRNLGREIEAPMRQPMHASKMVEGGSVDFLIRHGDRSMLVRPAAGYRAGDLEGVRADILFLAVGALGNQPPAFRRAFYEETVGRVHPRLIVPLHWDSPFRSLFEPLRGTPEAIDNVRDGLDAVIGPAARDGIPVMMLNALRPVPLDRHFAGAGEADRSRPIGGCAAGD